MTISLAVLGFEFEHHVPAVKLAIDKLKISGIKCDVKIWSSRDGIRKSVESNFKSCKFIDGGLGWLGKIPGCEHTELAKDQVKLDQLELKHLSYTFSRTTFFENPANISDKKIKLFSNLVDNCMCKLEEEGISHIFFSKIPHSLDDLGFYYAANRLGLPVVYTENPYFGGDYVHPVLGCKYKIPRSASAMRDKNFYKYFCASMSKRNLNISLDRPRYQTADLSYLPSVPRCETPFFRFQLTYNIYKFTRMKSFSGLIERFCVRLLGFLSMGLRLYFSKKYVAHYSPDREDKYILVLLQYHPEATTSPSALDTPFEEERIALLARIFPTFKILVREHPTNLKEDTYAFFQYRSLKALKKILSAKNVLYIWPGDRLNYKRLIERAFFTVSTRGTVALESIMLRTPTVHFSESFATGFPGVVSAREVTDITETRVHELRDQLKNITDRELIDLCYQSFYRDDLSQGFINGYHELNYTPEQYIEKASEIIYRSLVAVFGCCHEGGVDVQKNNNYPVF